MTDCPFCKIAGGELEAVVLYKTERVTSFLDYRPVGKGHALVISNAHFTNIMDADDTTVKEAMLVAKKITVALQKSFNPLGINIIQNNGYHAGQTIFHFHIHVIPRYDETYSNMLEEIAKRRKVVSNDDLQLVKENIRPFLE
ncbi:MAG: HIT domain-containing protein [Thermoplasmatales archaeon]